MGNEAAADGAREPIVSDCNHEDGFGYAYANPGRTHCLACGMREDDFIELGYANEALAACRSEAGGRIRSLENRLKEIGALAQQYEADPIDVQDRPSSWGKLRALIDAALSTPASQKETT